MYELYHELVRYYEIPNEGMFIARRKLLDIGVDTTPEEEDMRLLTYGTKEDKR
jgi:hypothetical protein